VLFKYYSVEKDDDGVLEYIFGFNDFIKQPDDNEEVYVDDLYCVYSRTVNPKTGEYWEGPINRSEMTSNPRRVIVDIFED